MVSADFNTDGILYHDYFEFELNHHVTGVDWQPFMVEAFLISNSAKAHKRSKQKIDSLVICSLEEHGRSMLFPEFRFCSLYMCTTSISNRHLSLTDQKGNRFTLKCPNESLFHSWKCYLLKLFPESLQPTLSLSKAIEHLNKQTLSTEFSCLNEKSTNSENLTKQLNGLNIFTGIAINTTHSSSDSSKIALDINNWSLQTDDLLLDTSLVDAPELKQFMLEDSSTFDKQIFSDSLHDNTNISSSFNEATNHIPKKSSSFNSLDIPFFEKSFFNINNRYYENAEDSYTIETIDTTADTDENTVDNCTGDTTQYSDSSLTDILDAKKDTTVVDLDTVDSPVPVLPILPKSLPLYCPEVPTMAADSVRNISFNIDLQKQDNTYYSSPLKLPPVITRNLKPSISNNQPGKILFQNASLKTLDEDERPSTALDRRLSESLKPSKLSKKWRLISVLKSFSSKLKSKSSYDELDADFEIVNLPTSQNIVLEPESQNDSFLNCQPVQLNDIFNNPTDSNSTYALVDLKKRSGRVLSRISEEQFFGINEEDPCDTILITSTDKAENNYHDIKEETDFDIELDSLDLPVVLTAMTAVKALPSFVEPLSDKTSVAFSSQIIPKLELTELGENDFAKSCMLVVTQAGTDFESNSIASTARTENKREISSKMMWESNQHKTLRDCDIHPESPLFSQSAHSRCSSESSTTSGLSIKVFGSDATLADTYQYSKTKFSGDTHTSTKFFKTSSSSFLLTSSQTSLNFPTVKVLIKEKNAPTGSWTPISKNLVTVSVSSDGKTIACWQALQTSVSNDSLRTICVSNSELTNTTEFTRPDADFATASLSCFSSVISNIIPSENKPLLTLELDDKAYVLKKSMYDVLVCMDSGDQYMFQLRSQAVTSEFYRAVNLHIATTVFPKTRQKFMKTHRHQSLHKLKPPVAMTTSRSFTGNSVSGRPLIVPPLLSSGTNLTDENNDSCTSPDLPLLLSDQRCLLFKATSTSLDRWEKVGLALIAVAAATDKHGKTSRLHLKLHQIEKDSIVVDTFLPVTCFNVAGPVALSISDSRTGQLKYLVRLRDQAERDRVAAALFGDIL